MASPVSLNTLKKEAQASLQSALKQNLSVKAMANSLFLISASYFTHYSMGDKEKHLAFNNYANKTLKDAVSDDILKEKLPKTVSKKIEYWVEVMQQLVQKGDFNSAGIIRLVIDELQYKKEERLQKAFARLPEATESQLNSFQAGRNLRALDVYQNQYTTVPFIEIFGLLSDMTANAKSLGKSTQTGARKTEEVAHKARENMVHTAGLAMNELFDFEQFISDLEQYRDQHKKESVLSRYDRAKYELSELLIAQLKSTPRLYRLQAEILQNFIEQAPKLLGHDNPLQWLRKKEFTLLEMVKDALVKVQPLALYENAVAQSAKELAQAMQTTAVIENQKEENRDKDKLTQKWQTGERTANSSQESLIGRRVLAEKTLEPQSPVPVTTSSAKSSFSEKKKFFEDLIQKNNEEAESNLPRKR